MHVKRLLLTLALALFGTNQLVQASTILDVQNIIKEEYIACDDQARIETLIKEKIAANCFEDVAAIQSMLEELKMTLVKKLGSYKKYQVLKTIECATEVALEPIFGLSRSALKVSLAFAGFMASGGMISIDPEIARWYFAGCATSGLLSVTSFIAGFYTFLLNENSGDLCLAYEMKIGTINKIDQLLVYLAVQKAHASGLWQ